MSQIANDLFPNTSTSPLGKKYLNQRQMITLARWLERSHQRIVDLKLGDEGVAHLAQTELEFPITKSHVRSLRKNLGLQWAARREPRTSTANRTRILARAILNLAAELGVTLDHRVRLIAGGQAIPE